MSLLIFLKIFAVCLLGAMSPGPSMVVVINNAIFKNRVKWHFNINWSWIRNRNLRSFCSYWNWL